MSSIHSILLLVQVLSSLAIIVLVLLQQGKGADMGSSFGSGSAGSLFGATGAANFLSRTTKWAAVVFFASTAGLAYISHAASGAGGQGVGSGVMQGYQQNSTLPPASQIPATPAAGGAAPGATPGAAPAAQPDAATPASPVK